MRRLLDSFVHNVVLHPLLFVGDVAARVGAHGLALLAGNLHDDHGRRWEAADAPVEEELKHELQPPPQDPWTPEAEAMVFRGRAQIRPPPPIAPLAGSAADRVQRARGTH